MDQARVGGGGLALGCGGTLGNLGGGRLGCGGTPSGNAAAGVVAVGRELDDEAPLLLGTSGGISTNSQP